MRIGLISVVAGALLIGAAAHAGAQDASAAGDAGETAGYATVVGLTRGDLLNIRAAASAIGMVIARVPNGTLVKVADCSAAGGNLWCKVEGANDPAATGWVPGRYLSGYEDQAMEVTAAASAKSTDELSIMSSEATFGVAKAKASTEDPRTREVVASFYTEPLQTPGDAAADPAGQAVMRDFLGGRAVAPLIGLPVVPGEGDSLGASAGGDADAPDLPQSAAIPSASPGERAADSALPSASGHAAPPAAPAARAPTVPTVEPATAAPPDTAPQQDAGSVPLIAAAPAPASASETQAAEEPAETSPLQSIAGALRGLFGGEEESPVESAAEAGIQASNHAAVPTTEPQVALAAPGIGGEVPCARYLGQPMTMCRAAIVREEGGAAVVTVNWPDGGKRLIRFRDGRMEGSDSSQPFRAVREADLNMIRIGKTERFEITDALAFGD